MIKGDADIVASLDYKVKNTPLSGCLDLTEEELKINKQSKHWYESLRGIDVSKSHKDTLIPKALEKQVGGSHYKKFKIQPAEFCHINGIGYLEATAIKYLCRWRDKGGVQDLDKAIHFIELLKEFENALAK